MIQELYQKLTRLAAFELEEIRGLETDGSESGEMGSWWLLLLLLHLALGNEGRQGSSSSRPALMDSTDPVLIRHVAFGSCNKQKYPQPAWRPLSDLAPQLFLWLGDAIYVHGQQPADLEAAYQHQLAHPDYRRFRENTRVEGTYDDHDYGVNDGGKHVDARLARQRAFLSFLQLDQQHGLDARWSRTGLYSSHEWGPSPERTVRVIFLDTRFHRDYHVIPSIGSVASKLAPIAAFGRMLSALLGLGSNYQGDVLGEEQWKWLEQQLTGPLPAVTIVVSSIQVLTSNPFVESWGHFAHSRLRLLQLLSQSNAHTCLLLLSGDVHFAELTGNTKLGGLLEVTTSGLTHSIGTSTFSLLYRVVAAAFSSHRYASDSYYTQRNFGTMRLDWEASTMSIQIHNAENGEVVLRLERSLRPGPVLNASAVPVLITPLSPTRAVVLAVAFLSMLAIARLSLLQLWYKSKRRNSVPAWMCG
eukprot:g35372.t1